MFKYQKAISTEEESFQVLFQKQNIKSFVMAVIYTKKDDRIPTEGYASHKEDEYQYVADGNIDFYFKNGEKVCASEGDSIVIPAEEPHYTITLSDECRLIGVLIGTDEK
ncbi:cupin domain-containing protein [Xenorhabdus sp. XENO-7]|uniref:Cupin domain-containing protein n=1 Tax=Xenorhabdus aichiensis TaxID=3025874 RepID=A0ABT5LXL9_9GAMM|nr:cupin domain-containing protein [Xenorhabdus aichiensis]MDC9620180.1 cupin domain-containing protein [Xenorhabdus aichiensis]